MTGGAIALGRLSVPLLPLLLLLAGFAGLWAAKPLGRRSGIDAEPALLRVMTIGLLAARLSFVWSWRSLYAAQPWSVFDIRDGGWDPALGVAAAALYAIHLVRRQPALRRAIAGGFGLALVLGVAAAVGLASMEASRAPLPALRFAPLEGGPPVELRGFAGKPTVVNLWATWCPPCRREMPLLLQAQREHPEVNFVFVNQGETPADVRRFLQAQGLRLRNVLLDPSLSLGAAFNQHALPTSLFFGADGRLMSTRLGELSPAVLAQRLQAAGRP